MKCDWKRLVFWIITGIIFLLASFIPMTDVHSQEATSLVIDPAESDVPCGDEVSLQIVVAGGLDVNAYDVTVVYDEERLELMSWEYGDYLSNQYAIYKEDQPGRFRLAATQLAMPGVSGDGILLELIFAAKATGTANVEIAAAEFADPEGNLSYPECESGEVLVTADPTYTPTPSITPTFTQTPTPTKTGDQGSKGTPTPTFTRTPTFTQTPTRTRTSTTVRTSAVTRTDEISTANTFTPSPTVTKEQSAEEIAAFTSTAIETEDQGSSQGEDEPNQETTTPMPSTGGDSALSPDQGKWVNLLLWSVLAVGLIAIVLMLFVLFRRRKDKQEDLLL